ncbi:TPA: DpnD/PcfM family protein [Streptococcus pneumoniae]|nr:DpnD/PcfM family protein [Streptococcus pneumoniae]HEV6116299.1 DpnD/PcfM family protein [Streptococcus pneumoniae]HEV7155437.1 DpnD/PcfM family protein [Streptococcus pneumoniae]HEV9914447.1 DpnD/PcfM family protein [Streptococcus pneumoniae]
MKTKQLVASEEVYDFLKVIWPDYETESRYDNLSLIVCTLSDPDCVRWLSENMKFGDEKQLASMKEKYGWEVGDKLPEWLHSSYHRLLLIGELLESNLKLKKYTVEITETLSRLVSIEAENPDEAERLVREKYKSCEIVLDADDFQDYDTSIYE